MNNETLNESRVKVTSSSPFIPEVNPLYVQDGNYFDVHKIVESAIFYPIFITGQSGCGKTLMVEQVCANLQRPLFRINITEETDEDDLLGGFRLVNGETVWQDGPIVEAMKAGGVALIDEVDLGSNKILCLQPVLEGKGVLLKKVNVFIKPSPGFNVIATANTKGRGSDDGRFIGTRFMNEAFLERFAITIEQEYPKSEVELAILDKVMDSSNDNKMFAQNLVNWAKNVREVFQDRKVDEVISTRRLVLIANAHKIFNSRERALELCLSRFDTHIKSSFLTFYEKIDADFKSNSQQNASNSSTTAFGGNPSAGTL